MIVARSHETIDRVPAAVVTVGTFDGVHLAHRRILEDVVDRARPRGHRAVVLTFEPHPKQVVRSERGPVRLLTSLDERLGLLEEAGIDLVVVVAFTEEFSHLSPRAFYTHHVLERMAVAEVVVGYDHMFGRGRTGGRTELEAIAREAGFRVSVVPPLTVDDEPVSSTRIRAALAAGDVDRAGRLLGYPYRLAGRVVEGDRRGRSLGYPTANILPDDPAKVVPANGVYVVRARLESEALYGMLNIGARPTVTDGRGVTIEVHLLNFEAELYGERLQVEFLQRLRDEERFPSVEALVAQLRNDETRSRAIIAAIETTRSSTI